MVSRAVLKQQAKQSMAEHRPSVYLVTLVYLLILAALSFLSDRLLNFDAYWRSLSDSLAALLDGQAAFSAPILPSPALLSVSVILSAAIAAARAVIGAGQQFFCLKTSRGEAGGYMDIFEGFTRFGKVLWLSILIGLFSTLWSVLLFTPAALLLVVILAVYAPALIGLMFLLLIGAFVGIILITLRYGLAFFILFDNRELRAIDCLRKSKRLMRGHIGYAFTLDLSFIGWLLLAALISWLLMQLHSSAALLSPLMIWLYPYMRITWANFYNVLIGHRSARLPYGPPEAEQHLKE